jgi:50S ribosomal protein L16 3-hydroxylase
MNAIILDLRAPLTILGGISPDEFMKQYWQKKPLLIRQAFPDIQPPIQRTELFELAQSEQAESRLIQQTEQGWSLVQGPFEKKQWPSFLEPRWTLLVQGVNHHVQAAHEILSQFRFIPDARLDDLMVSYATTGGGVGPHFDSYDVFLLQVQGHRRWRIGRMKNPELQENVPLKILTHFHPEQEWLLEPGDMLYLPPRWAHDGVAEDECMTCSIGFRSPSQKEFASEILQRVVDALWDDDDEPATATIEERYKDPNQKPTLASALIPAAIYQFAQKSIHQVLNDPLQLQCATGEWLSEPKPGVYFDEGREWAPPQALQLDRRTRMLFDEHFVFINGQSYVAEGRDAELIRQLANARNLSTAESKQLTVEAADLLQEWARAGWLHSMT